ncbi:MAG: RsmB/NOP family class I SAM-dependent RNA methyltransferase [Rhodothermales bacterium]
MNIPSVFLDRCRTFLSEPDMERLLGGIQSPRVTAFRPNPLLSGAAAEPGVLPDADLWSELADGGLRFHRAPWDDQAAWVSAEDRQALLESAAAREGRLYVQSLSSQLPVPILDPQPGERFLDLAAAPGSKTLQLAARVPGAHIAAVEVVKKRMYKLKDNLTMHGAGHVKIFLQDGTKVWRYRPDHFDRVLIDAPCSSEGRFQVDDPDTMAWWSPRKVKEMVRKQRRLLYSALRAVRPGGIVVYSTCAISPEENEAVVQSQLDAFEGQVTIEPIEWPVDMPERIPALTSWKNTDFDAGMAGCLRILPSERMEGFFVCRLRRGD